MSAKQDLDRELERLSTHLPGWMARTVDRMRQPSAVWIRIPGALVLVAGGVVGFLPILGFWMVPLGLALLAFDIPFLRGPLARLLAFVNRKLASHAG